MFFALGNRNKKQSFKCFLQSQIGKNGVFLGLGLGRTGPADTDTGPFLLVDRHTDIQWYVNCRAVLAKNVFCRSDGQAPRCKKASKEQKILQWPNQLGIFKCRRSYPSSTYGIQKISNSVRHVIHCRTHHHPPTTATRTTDTSAPVHDH